jgi:hypothetical protein
MIIRRLLAIFIALSALGGAHTNVTASTESATPGKANGYTEVYAAPPANATLAEGTTVNGGRWHKASNNETCVGICAQESISHALFVAVNPSLNDSQCSEKLQAVMTYCAGPL